jgi:hypothetical protein
MEIGINMHENVKRIIDQWDEILDDEADFDVELAKLVEIVVFDVINNINDVKYESGKSLSKIIETVIKNHYGLEYEH